MTPHVADFWRETSIMVLAALLSGCTSWSGRPVGVTEALRSSPNEPLQLTLNDGSRRTFYRPTIVGDSLVGYRVGGKSPAASTVIATALRDIRGAEVLRVSKKRTALAVSATALAGTTIVWAINSYRTKRDCQFINGHAVCS